MGCCGEASGWAKVGLLLVAVATGLQITGYVTNHWMVYNTVKDTYDVRVGLWWMQNCSFDAVICNKQNVPDIYKTEDLFFLLVRCFEGAGAGFMFIILLLSGFYVATDRCRTKPVACTVLFLNLLAAVLSATGIGLWVWKIVFSPYFPAWSMGLCALAAALCLLSCMCTIPDIKEYPYDKNKAVGPLPRGTEGRYNHLDDEGNEPTKRRPSDMQYTGHGYDSRGDQKRKSDLGKEYGRRDQRREDRYSREYDPYPYGPQQMNDHIDHERFELDVITPRSSAPLRHDYTKKK